MVHLLRTRLRDVAAAVAASSHRPKVVVLTSTEPLCLAGWWVPDMLSLAGGQPCTQLPGCAPLETSWDQVGSVLGSHVFPSADACEGAPVHHVFTHRCSGPSSWLAGR